MNQQSQQQQVQQQQQSQNQMNKVVSLRNIPNEITDLAIVLMGLQFGDVVNILYLKGKGQVSKRFISYHFFQRFILVEARVLV